MFMHNYWIEWPRSFWKVKIRSFEKHPSLDISKNVSQKSIFIIIEETVSVKKLSKEKHWHVLSTGEDLSSATIDHGLLLTLTIDARELI